MNLNKFKTGNLYETANDLFVQLNIKFKSQITTQTLSAKDVLKENFKDSAPFVNIKDLYFIGAIDEELFSNQEKMFDDNSFDAVSLKANHKEYKGLVIFALELDKTPNRSEIAQLTRAFNKIYDVAPVGLVIKYENKISISLNERFKYLQEWREGEKSGKVIVLRDIDLENTHAGHLRILVDLSKHNAKNFNELHKKWLEVLSIKTLNDEFYERLVGKMDKKGNVTKKGWYFKCFEDIKIDLSKASKVLCKKVEEELKPQAVIRIIIRLMFIWFMKEKKLIKPDFFTKQFAKDFLKNENTYYNAVLQNMFFAVLNAKISERRFRSQNNANKYDTEGNEYGMLQFFRYEDFFKQGKANEFKKLTDEIPFVNGGLFTCHDQKIKYNKSENYIIDGFSDNTNDSAKISDNVIFDLIDLFNDYVFTIEESTPTEQDIALDPELLGTIFENLIGFYNPETKENARKQTGSFYTPREIVDYMCSESLKESLKTRFFNLDLQIDKLIDNNEDFLNFPDKNKMLAAITDLKILDPACGSGAFPMGMFNLMVRTVEKLQEHKTTYKNKLDIIENCIYGVDIQNIAIEITKLRFFISLLVDYDIPENVEKFDVLPNLETKFVVANTLIGIKLNEQTNIFGVDTAFSELTKIFLPFTTAKTPKEKEKIKNDFAEKKQDIVNDTNFNFGDNVKDKILAWNPFNVCYCSPFFDSQIMFGIKDGFDIVIGNPPYVQLPRNIFNKNQFPYSEGKDKGKQNLYKVFVESSYNLTKENGISAMIVQSSLMCDLSSQFTRELLLTKTEIKEIIEFPKKAKTMQGQVFDNVLQGTCVYFFKHKNPRNDKTFKISIDNDITTLDNLQYETLKQNEILTFYPNGYFIPLIHKGEFDIIKRMQLCSMPLKEITTEITKGDLNLGSESRHFSKNMSNVKLLRGKNIHRYFINYNSDEFIQNCYKEQKVELNRNVKYFISQNITGTTDKFRLHFAVTELNHSFLFGDSANKFSVKPEINEEFLLGVLNSKLLDWYFRKTSTNNHVNGYEIENLPICNVENQQPIILLVEQILSAKKENPQTDTTDLEREIDLLVYELYGLSEEEINIVENKNSVSN